MYTLVLYDDDNRIVDYYTGMEKPTCQDNNVKWHNGEMRGIQLNFIIIPGTHVFEYEQDVSDYILEDMKEELKTFENQVADENMRTQTMLNDLFLLSMSPDPMKESQMQQMQMMINDLMLLSIGGMNNV